MNEEKFTPGEWIPVIMTDLPEDVTVLRIMAGHEEIGAICPCEKAEANAQLISKSPKLYKALKNLTEAMEDVFHMSRIDDDSEASCVLQEYMLALQALREARGEE